MKPQPETLTLADVVAEKSAAKSTANGDMSSDSEAKSAAKRQKSLAKAPKSPDSSAFAFVEFLRKCTAEAAMAADNGRCQLPHEFTGEWVQEDLWLLYLDQCAISDLEPIAFKKFGPALEAVGCKRWTESALIDDGKGNPRRTRRLYVYVPPEGPTVADKSATEPSGSAEAQAAHRNAVGNIVEFASKRDRVSAQARAQRRRKGELRAAA